jgi:hypothetical protein
MHDNEWIINCGMTLCVCNSIVLISCLFNNNYDVPMHTNELTLFHQVHPDLRLSEKRSC